MSWLRTPRFKKLSIFAGLLIALVVLVKQIDGPRTRSPIYEFLNEYGLFHSVHALGLYAPPYDNNQVYLSGRWRKEQATLVPCKTIIKESLVVLVLGQSNAGNRARPARGSSEPRLTTSRHPKSYGFNIFDGTCRKLRDPAPGAGGEGASPWPTFADRLAAHTDENVIVVSAPVGGLTVQAWANYFPSTEHPPAAPRLAIIANALKDHLRQPDLIIWFQGESDNLQGTSSQEYQRQFKKLMGELRHYGLRAPILMSKTSICRSGRSKRVRTAQETLIAAHDFIHAGPDTDDFDMSAAMRPDKCHFSITAARGVGEAFARHVKRILARKWQIMSPAMP